MAPLKFPIAVALAGLLLWLQVCNKIPMVNALCQDVIIRCARPTAVPGIICSDENADAICRQECRRRGSGFYSDQDCCRTNGLCCCLPVYPNVNDDDYDADDDDGGGGDDDDDEGESSSQPDYRTSNNVIDYIGSADDGNNDHGVNYREFDFVDGPIDDEVSESSQVLVDDQGENSSPPNDNGDEENS